MQVSKAENLRELLPHRPRLLAELRRRDAVIELLPPDPGRELELAVAPGYGKTLICSDEGGARGIMLIRNLRWESKIFNLKMGLVKLLTSGGDAENAIAKTLIDAAVGGAGYDYLLLSVLDGEAAPDPRNWRHGLELADMVNLRHSLENIPQIPPPAGVKIRPLAGGDSEQVKNISATAFVYDRYTIDPALPDDRVERAHRGWAGECCRFCDLVLVAECDKMIAGFCAVFQPAAGPGIVQLIAVDRASRRRGIGGGLLSGALNWFRGRTDGVVIRTEQPNAPALGLYRAMGFEPYARFGYARFLKIRGSGTGSRVSGKEKDE